MYLHWASSKSAASIHAHTHKHAREDGARSVGATAVSDDVHFLPVRWRERIRGSCCRHCCSWPASPLLVPVLLPVLLVLLVVCGAVWRYASSEHLSQYQARASLPGAVILIVSELYHSPVTHSDPYVVAVKFAQCCTSVGLRQETITQRWVQKASICQDRLGTKRKPLSSKETLDISL